MEHSWVNTLEEKVKATDNLPESTEAISEALEVQIPTHTHMLTHFMNPIIYTQSFVPPLLLIILKAAFFEATALGLYHM